jgi:hypothetical protein
VLINRLCQQIPDTVTSRLVRSTSLQNGELLSSSDIFLAYSNMFRLQRIVSVLTGSEQIMNKKSALMVYWSLWYFIHLALRKTTYLVRTSNDTTAVTFSYLLNTSLDGHHCFSLLRGNYVLSMYLLNFLLKLPEADSVLSDIRTVYLSNTDHKRNQRGVLVVRNPDPYSGYPNSKPRFGNRLFRLNFLVAFLSSLKHFPKLCLEWVATASLRGVLISP